MQKLSELGLRRTEHGDAPTRADAAGNDRQFARLHPRALGDVRKEPTEAEVVPVALGRYVVAAVLRQARKALRRVEMKANMAQAREASMIAPVRRDVLDVNLVDRAVPLLTLFVLPQLHDGVGDLVELLASTATIDHPTEIGATVVAREPSEQRQVFGVVRRERCRVRKVTRPLSRKDRVCNFVNVLRSKVGEDVVRNRPNPRVLFERTLDPQDKVHQVAIVRGEHSRKRIGPSI